MKIKQMNNLKIIALKTYNYQTKYQVYNKKFNSIKRFLKNKKRKIGI